MSVIVYGYRPSVYTRILKLVLHLKSVHYEMREVDPFADPPDPLLATVTGFDRVPVLDHDGFLLCETAAICCYVDRVFPTPGLCPTDAKSLARMDQVIAIIDAYGYFAMVRKVFEQRIVYPLIGTKPDQEVIDKGVAESRSVLEALETIADEGLVLNGNDLSLADLHLAPMMAYFVLAPEGQEILPSYPRLAHWWQGVAHHPAMEATAPDISAL